MALWSHRCSARRFPRPLVLLALGLGLASSALLLLPPVAGAVTGRGWSDGRSPSLAAPVRLPGAGLIQRIGPVRPLLGGSAQQSTNWAGYDATGGGFTSVTATWIQPCVQPNYSKDTRNSIWVGLDGDGSSTVEQTGTATYSHNGVVSYYAWYEMIPDAEVPIDGLIISPGDVMTGTVTSDGLGDFTLTILDNTTGWYGQTVQSNGVTDPYSAEAIVEAPTNWLGFPWPLANFGTMDFTSCAFNGQPISAFNWNRIDMVSGGGATVAATSALGAGGASFSVKTAVTPDVTAPTTTVSGNDNRWHNHAVRLTFTASDPGGLAVAATYYEVDAGSWTKGTSVSVAAPSTHVNDGLHTVRYYSVDQAKNPETAKSCTVRIDTRKPYTKARPATVVRGRTATLGCAVIDAKPCAGWASVKVWVKNLRGKVVYRLAYARLHTGAWFYPKFRCTLAKGTYRYYVYATDAAGNTQSKVGWNKLVVK